jgi:hypothetical protein
MPTISRTGTAVVASATASTIVGLITAPIAGPFETQSVELCSEILPFRIGQLRLIDAFDSSPELPLFPTDSRAKVIAAKGHVPLSAVR